MFLFLLINIITFTYIKGGDKNENGSNLANIKPSSKIFLYNNNDDNNHYENLEGLKFPAEDKLFRILQEFTCKDASSCSNNGVCISATECRCNNGFITYYTT